MKIYFNSCYTSRACRCSGTEDEFGTAYCGGEDLLRIMMLHGGIVGGRMSAEERGTVYHNAMKDRIRPEHLFYASFLQDSLATSSAVLAWRDALVAAGWDLVGGDSPKLQFIREMEPGDLPKGPADCWNQVLRLSEERLLFPADTEIIVTQPEESVEPRIVAILRRQARLGVRVSFRPDTEPVADGNLGRIQRWMLEGRKGKIELGADDGTLELLRFRNEEDAMRYVAVQAPERWALYYCRRSKRFDNVLRLLGQPVCGSCLEGGDPQTVQLFALGNGLFEYPLNLHRILAWLNAPIHPLGRKLCRRLAEMLAASGGVENVEWNQVIEEYLTKISDERDREKERERIAAFLPFPKSTEIQVERVRSFNRALRNWALGLLAMEEFPYDGIVREQLDRIRSYCGALLNLLPEGRSGIDFVELQRWCRSIVSPGSYLQYDAEAGCREVISSEGDIHDPVGSLVWLCIEDGGVGSYPFDFLTEAEYADLKKCGVFLYDKTFHSSARTRAVSQMLLRVRRLTLVECAEMGGEPLKRHPLMLQLNEAVSGGLGPLFRSPELPASVLVPDQRVANHSADPVLQLDADAVLPPRKEESYSSLDLLIQHPFDYVCRYGALLQDTGVPTMEDLDRIQGNVAHAVIERIFEAGTDRAQLAARIRDRYAAVFNETVDRVGLLLRQPENVITLRNMEKQMPGMLERLLQIITDNDLMLDGCEHEFRNLLWDQAGEGVSFASRADMLLTDRRGNKVIFDFKWSGGLRWYKQRLQDNTALQLAIYKRLAEQEFGCDVRAAYILLPEVDLLSVDRFSGAEPVVVKDDAAGDLMLKAERAYRFRREQFAAGRIERAEGLPAGESEYGRNQQESGLYPLETNAGGILSENRFSDFKKLR